MTKKLQEGDIRRFLVEFADRIREIDYPVGITREECLMQFLNEHSVPFMLVRQKLSKARVDLLESARLMSKKADKRDVFRREVESLTSERQELIAEAFGADEFRDYLRELREETERRRQAWKNDREVLSEIEKVLALAIIPSIEVNEMDPSLIVEAVNSRISASTGEIPVGNMILRNSEPVGMRPEFRPRGLDRGRRETGVLGHRVGLLISPADPRASSLETAGAVSSGGRLLMPLTQDGLAAPGVDASVLDEFLPVAAKRTVVPFLPELIPSSSWGASLANLLTPASWQALRGEALDRSAGFCTMCGGAGRIDVHELWEYGEPVVEGYHGIQRLAELVPLCHLCHDMHHIGRARVQKRERPVLERLRRVNRWSQDELRNAVALMEERFSRRSRFVWALDISLLKGKVLQVNSKWTFSDDGWLEVPGETATRIYGVAWKQPPHIEMFDPMPKVHFIGHRDTVVIETGEIVEIIEDTPPPSAAAPATSAVGTPVAPVTPSTSEDDLPPWDDDDDVPEDSGTIASGDPVLVPADDFDDELIEGEFYAPSRPVRTSFADPE